MSAAPRASSRFAVMFGVFGSLFVVAVWYFADQTLAAVEAGATVPTYQSAPPAESLRTGYSRHAFPIKGRGAIEVEYLHGAPGLSIRHTPVSGSERISYWSGDAGVPITGVEALPADAPTSIFIYSGGADASATGSGEVRAMIAFTLPLGDLKVVPLPPGKSGAHRDCDYEKETDGASGQIQEDQFDVGELVALAEGVGAEKRAGLPPLHVGTASVKMAREVVLMTVLDDRDSAGHARVLATSQTSVFGELGAPESGGEVWVEFGQLKDKQVSFNGWLSVNGGAVASIDLPAPEMEIAIPDRLRDPNKPVLYVAHQRAVLPAGTQTFELIITFEQELVLSGDVRCWYFTAEDFGQQGSLPAGYEAFVLWNRAVDLRGSIRVPTGADKLSVEAVGALPPQFVGTLAEKLGREKWSGFRVHAPSDVSAASVYYRARL